MKYLLILLCALSLVGCKIIYDTDESLSVIPDGPDGDDARNTERLETTFSSELLPLITDKALDVATLRAAITSDIDAAGNTHGNRGAGRGAAWNFSIADTGQVIDANLTSSARTADVDVDEDGKADLRLQLGPVIRGTVLRDVAPFYNFDDFRDQIEFAKLARAINERAKAKIVVPEGDLIGRTVSFTGVTAVKSATDKLVVTMIDFAVEP